MTTWRQPFKAQLAHNAQRPVFLFIVTQGHALAWGEGGAWPSTQEYLVLDADESMEVYAEQDLIIWNNDSFELVKVDGPSGDYIYLLGSRGQYGTKAITLSTNVETMASIAGAYCTHTLGDDASGFTYHPGSMQFPEGGGVSLDTLNGRTNFSDITVTIADNDGQLSKLFRTSPIIGERGILLGGYEGMALADFEFIWTGRIGKINFRDGIAADITVESIIHKLEKKLFEHIDVFNDSGATIQTWITSLIGVTVGTGKYIPVSTAAPSHDDERGATYDGYAAYHIKADDEWARIDSHSLGIDLAVATHPALGSPDLPAGSSHQGSPATLAFVVEDNVIDILLGLLLTRDNNLPMSEADGPDGLDYNFYNVGTVATFDGNGDLTGAGGPLGLGFFEAEVDVAAIELVRDIYFKHNVARVIFDGAENMRPWLEKHLFKPKNLNYIITRTGKFSITTLMPPVGVAVDTLTESEIIGVPSQDMDNTEIINDVTVEWDYNDGEFTGTPHRQIDETSIVDYEQHGSVTIEDRTAYSGGSIPRDGELSIRNNAKRKYRNRRKPHPVVTIRVPMTKADIEVGKVLDVTHSKMTDTIKGQRGWVDKRVAVVGRHPRWSGGYIDLEVIETVYRGRNYALIAPAGTSDWTSATDDEKTQYAFVSSTTNEAEGVMSDGERGYHIV